MNFKRYIEASNTWVDSHYIMGTDTDTLTTLPAVLYPNGTTATVGLKGNMSQTGTPTPTTPIQPQECGERTGNLFDISAYSTYTTGISNIVTTSNSITYTATSTLLAFRYFFPLNTTDIFTIQLGSESSKVRLELRYRKNESTVGDPIVVTIGNSYVIRGSEDVDEIQINISNGVNTGTCTASNIMLNTGSTLLPYENFGYKIPISSGGENLFDKDNYNLVFGYFVAEGATTITGESNNNIVYIPCKPNTTYTVSKILSNRFGIGYTIDKPAAGVIVYGAVIGYTATSLTVTTDSSAKYIVAYVRNGNAAGTSTLSEIVNSLQITESSEPLPYEPYNRTTTPIYLGEVPTTRRIKKLVLTGQEDWRIHPSISSWFQLYISDSVISSIELCSHYIPSPWTPALIQNGEILVNYDGSTTNRIIIRDTTYTTLDDFKTYLAQQYAAGTPVTVWYVLATEETGIVNEPIRKIGDYADTVSGIIIPTIAGKDTFDVLTTLKPSEVSLAYTGWHDASAKEWDGSQWD